MEKIKSVYNTLSKKEKKLLIEIYENNGVIEKSMTKETPEFTSKIANFIDVQVGGQRMFLKNDLMHYIKYFVLNENAITEKRLSDYQVNLLKLVKNEEQEYNGVMSDSLNVLFNEDLIKQKDGKVIITIKGEKFLENIERYTTIEMEENAKKLLNETDLFLKIMEDMDKFIIGEKETKMLTFLLFLSKLSNIPSHLYLTAPAASGKSYLLNNVADYFDDGKTVERKTRLTAHALDYMEGKDFTNMILLVQEAGGVKETTSIRPLLSGDQKGLIISVVERDEMGKLKTVDKKLKGTPVFATSDITINIEEQFATRVWNINLDLSEKQTKEILSYQRKKRKCPWLFKDLKKNQEIITAISLLEKKDVIIPFTDILDFPYEKIRARRDNEKFMTLIEMSALLHQYQRPKLIKDGTEYIIANIDDLFLSLILGLKAITTSYLEMEERLRVFKEEVEKLYKKLEQSALDVNTISMNTNYSSTTVRQYMDELIKLGFAYKDEHPIDRRKIIYILAEKEIDAYFTFFRNIAREKFVNTLKEYFNNPEMEDVVIKHNGSTFSPLINIEALENALSKPLLHLRSFEKLFNGYFEENKPFYQFLSNNIKNYCFSPELINEIKLCPNPITIQYIVNLLEDKYDYTAEEAQILINCLEKFGFIKIENGNILHNEVEKIENHETFQN